MVVHNKAKTCYSKPVWGVEADLVAGADIKPSLLMAQTKNARSAPASAGNVAVVEVESTTGSALIWYRYGWVRSRLSHFVSAGAY